MSPGPNGAAQLGVQRLDRVGNRYEKSGADIRLRLTVDKLASLSLWELERLIRDRKVSPAVRFNAIKLSLALAGHVEPKAPEDEDALGGKPVSEMGLTELDAFLATERAKRASDAKPVLDAVAVDGEGTGEAVTIERGPPEPEAGESATGG
jgi:hypothetical protein